jgi:hypothetical protein
VDELLMITNEPLLVSHVVLLSGFYWLMNQDHGRDVLFSDFAALLKSSS